MEIIIAMSIAFVLGAWIRRPILPKRKTKPKDGRTKTNLTANDKTEEMKKSETSEDRQTEKISRQLDSLLNYTGENKE